MSEVNSTISCDIFGKRYSMRKIHELMDNDNYGKIYDTLCETLYDGRLLEDCDAIAYYIIAYINEYDDTPTSVTEKELDSLDIEEAKAIANRWRIWDLDAIEAEPMMPTITCPYCHSTNVERITLGKKAVKGWFWGIAAASTLTKEWHCKSCKSNF